MDSRQIFIVVITALSCFTAVFITLINTWGRARARKAAPAVDFARVESQIHALQQSVDAVALEVERISEGQRFTTRLLAERSGERVDTTR